VIEGLLATECVSQAGRQSFVSAMLMYMKAGERDNCVKLHSACCNFK
jgi:hypothetical protein